MKPGDKIKIRIPNSYKFKFPGEVVTGTIRKINKKSYEVVGNYKNSFFSLYVDKREYSKNDVAVGR